MRFAKVVTFIGIGLLVLAWVSAAFIPSQTNGDFDSFLRGTVGGVSHTVNFPDVYKQMGANRRMLQNFYIGAAGLVCLGVGLSCWTKQVEPSSEANISP